MRFLKEIFYLFFPNLCINCSTILLKTELFLCTGCKHSLPIINNNEVTQQMLQAIFYGRVSIKSIHSFLYYNKQGITQKIIHELKYKNQENIGVFLGSWFAYELKKENIFSNVDYIVPVPLHISKENKRGYNQVTKFAKTLSSDLEISYMPNKLIRTSKAKTQTLQQRFERFSKNETKFQLNDLEVFKNKHILLVDDVVTTGATLEACCNELLKTAHISISICTIAYTEKG